MENQNYILAKIEKVRNYIEERGADGILLTKKNNFSWITCGKRNGIINESEIGNSSVLITRNNCYLITDNIEEPRMYAEEIDDRLFKRAIFSWFEPQDKYKKIIEVVGSDNVISDVTFGNFDLVDDGFEKLKYVLDEAEKKVLRELGERTSKIISRVCLETKRGDGEFNCLGLLHRYLADEGISPNVSFVASDERIFNFRHPIATFKKVDRYFMVVVCSEFKGLIVSMSRSVYFGKLTGELEAKKDILAHIDAEIINNTRPGKTYADVFGFIKKMYEKYGHKDEWIHHLQGGPIGYSPRYFLANDRTNVPVEVGNAFAWNPTLKGIKSEDTFLIDEDLNKYISYDEDWPSIEIVVGDRKIKRPDILLRKEIVISSS
ncbi:MAG: aminopeptidase P family N-terminal domain-containing protein [Actinobacteria bacterium]|nr:aminopeptidase P family N-terminal domain-containing protein [Actinomycetota bacterium]MCL5986831.1 aminopeptidase P family N-terminal domain-containing protein [Actinomycetota bacterium]